jgi:PAS domain S-box-containing protein
MRSQARRLDEGSQFHDPVYVAPQESKDAARQLAALTELGREAVQNRDVSTLLSRAATIVASTFGNDYANVMELLPDGKALRLRAGVGWRDGLVGHATVEAGLDSQAGYTLLADKAVIVEDVRTDPRFHGPPLLMDHGAVSGMSVIIPGLARPWGTLGTHATDRRAFSADDVSFLQAVANLLAVTIERSQLLARDGAASIRADSADALRQGEERFHLLVESIKDYAIFLLDAQGRVASWNAGAERNTGYREREILGEHVSIFYTPEDVVQGKPARELRTAAAEGRDEEEGWRVRSDRSRFWAGVIMTALYDSEGRLAGFARVTRDLTERQQAAQALLATREDLAERLADFTRLYALATRLSSTADLKSAVDEVLAAVTSLQKTTSAVLVLDDRETGELYPLTSVGLPEAYLDLIRRVPRGTTESGVAVAERRIVIVEDLDREPVLDQDREALKLAGYRGIFSVPLLAPRDEIIGAIATYFPEPHAPSERELRQVQLYAHLAAGFLANARLIQEAQDAVRKRDAFLTSVYGGLRPTDVKDAGSMVTGHVALTARSGSDGVASLPDQGAACALPGHGLAHSWHEDERARFLRTVPVFRALPPDALRFAASVAQPRRVKPGEVVLLEGEPLEALRIVVEGRIKLVRETPEGREVILRIIGPRELFGIFGIGREPIHRAAAVAQVDTLYLGITSDEFSKLLKTHPAFALAAIRALGRRLYDAETRICTLQTEVAERRVAGALLKLMGRPRRDGPGDGRVDLPILREELALLAGTNVSTVSRSISEWTRRGIVDGGRKHVVIRDDHALRALAMGTDHFGSGRAPR